VRDIEDRLDDWLDAHNGRRTLSADLDRLDTHASVCIDGSGRKKTIAVATLNPDPGPS
jgi:hypothetical protein